MKKKIVYTVNEMTDLPVSHCPTCLKRVDMFLHHYEGVVCFCPYCGQELDWTGTEMVSDG